VLAQEGEQLCVCVCVCVCVPPQLLNQLADFHQIWYKHYATESNTNHVVIIIQLNSNKFFIIYVPSQQLQGQSQTQYRYT
jgi:hypothetical protein